MYAFLDISIFCSFGLFFNDYLFWRDAYEDHEDLKGIKPATPSVNTDRAFLMVVDAADPFLVSLILDVLFAFPMIWYAFGDILYCTAF